MKPTKAAAHPDRAAARRELFHRLAADYPHLPVKAVLNAVADADRALWLCGYGEDERLVLERACRHNLDALSDAVAGGEIAYTL